MKKGGESFKKHCASDPTTIRNNDTDYNSPALVIV